MNYYSEIKEQIIKNEINKKIKDYSKNRSDLNTYYNIGKLLYKADRQYGKGIIKEYSLKLTKEFGKKYTNKFLYKIIQFYELYEKVPTVSGKLSWSHYYELLSIKDVIKINYYIAQVEKQNLSVRNLRYRIKSNEYERLPEKTKNKLMKEQELEMNDLILNPIVIKTNNKEEELTEYALKETILNNLDEFLLQLGDGYTYVGNEYKIKIGNSYNYIDLLLFNYLYNSFIVVELKVTELRKEHIGQIEVYINYIDKNIKTINQDKTIGIIICKKDNKYVIEYSSDDRIFSRIYELI